MLGKGSLPNKNRYGGFFMFKVVDLTPCLSGANINLHLNIRYSKGLKALYPNKFLLYNCSVFKSGLLKVLHGG